jgi:hypothetical protein
MTINDPWINDIIINIQVLYSRMMLLTVLLPVQQEVCWPIKLQSKIFPRVERGEQMLPVELCCCVQQFIVPPLPHWLEGG